MSASLLIGSGLYALRLDKASKRFLSPNVCRPVEHLANSYTLAPLPERLKEEEEEEALVGGRHNEHYLGAARN